MIFQILFGAESLLKKAQKIYVGYHVPVEKMNDPKEVFDTLVHACDDFCAVSFNNAPHNL